MDRNMFKFDAKREFKILESEPPSSTSKDFGTESYNWLYIFFTLLYFTFTLNYNAI